MAGGLIPAHAGKTSRNPFVQAARRAHPRSRGENLVVSLEECVPVGSSPLTRGKRSCRDRLRRRGRLIPAHAGKTPPTRRTRRWPRAHPRSRGENKRMSCADHDHWGSSPLTRGKRAGRYVLQWPARLIPAHAGKTGACMRRPRQRRAHPRSRGENASWSSVCLLLRGSSPLTRGKRAACDWSKIARRLIPAHAGKTITCRVGQYTRRAHPRSRGENSVSGPFSGSMIGSSPLTRGKQTARVRVSRALGLIPAHAGKTRDCGFMARVPAAHPRSRGENFSRSSIHWIEAGSSPLTRGKRSARADLRSSQRLIPAHAGKTARMP